MTCTIHEGDALAVLRSLPDESAQTCVTSPPYWGLRDYGMAEQIGLEETPDAYVARLVEVFREVRRVLRQDGTLWLNVGDSYAASQKGGGGTANGTIANGKGQSTNAGSFYSARFNLDACGMKPKDLVGIPWLLAFALRADGWYLRAENIWHKPNPMPESVKDRTTRAHEQVFLLSRSARYFYDVDAVREPPSMSTVKRWGGNLARINPQQSGVMGHAPVSGEQSLGTPDAGRNLRSVWTITPEPFDGAHFATMPPELARTCIKAGSRPGDVVLDPFSGAGTTGLVARQLGRQYAGIELNPTYAAMSRQRIADVVPPTADEMERAGLCGQVGLFGGAA